jgi:hypothetical protein
MAYAMHASASSGCASYTCMHGLMGNMMMMTRACILSVCERDGGASHAQHGIQPGAGTADSR